MFVNHYLLSGKFNLCTRNQNKTQKHLFKTLLIKLRPSFSHEKNHHPINAQKNTQNTLTKNTAKWKQKIVLLKNIHVLLILSFKICFTQLWVKLHNSLFARGFINLNSNHAINSTKCTGTCETFFFLVSRPKSITPNNKPNPSPPIRISIFGSFPISK